MVTIVTATNQKHFGLRKISTDQRIKAFEFGDFASCYFRPDRESVKLGNEADFGREATF